MDDSYLKEFDAEVVSVDGKDIVLDQTAFHPVGGGLPSDEGFLIGMDGSKTRVEKVYKDRATGRILHTAPGHSFKPGDRVHGVIDWEKRYRIMRMHTALHVLIAILNARYGALVTGNQVGVERSRVDVNLERPDRELVLKAIDEANNVISRGIQVRIYYLPREDALKIPGIVKLARVLPPSVERLRIVEIPGVDIQADGGPHVANTSEIGKIIFLKLENKGRNNRRIYFTLEP